MAKTASVFMSYPVRLWARISEYLNQAAEREVNAWGASLQYKRRYTNPDAAKQFRRAV